MTSADKVSQAVRSLTMSRVRSVNTSSEIAVRKALHAAGFRFRLHRSDMPGKPDVVLRRYRMVILVHGCLWHGHKCKRFRWPVSNASYWRRKIERNVERDAQNQELLREAGWRVSVIWDCQLESGIEALLAELNQQRTFFQCS